MTEQNLCLLVGMDNEMHVYSQWRGGGAAVDMTGHDETDGNINNIFELS